MTVMTKVVEENLINEVLESKLADKDVEKRKNSVVTEKSVNGTDTKGKLPKEIGTDYQFKRKIVWFNAIGFLILHLMAIYGLILCFVSANLLTTVWMFLLMFASGEGVTMGAHRLYSHKTFKAHFIVRLSLVLLQTVAGQNCLYIWVRDHRLHHKYSDTDADPHNSNRGFFFSHMGWLMSRKHPAVISKGKTIDMSDLEADLLVMLQKDYYKPLYLVFAVAIPVAVPVYLWDETYINSFFISYMSRYIFMLHITWLVNSAAHLYGTRPYDHTYQPVENWFVGYVSVGEGWHNYHHVFPWDYRAAELGMKFNITTMLIDLLAYTGLVYDLKFAPEHMIRHRVEKAGDGSHQRYGGHHHEEVPHPDDVAHNLKENGYIIPTADVHNENDGHEINENYIIQKTNDRIIKTPDEIIPGYENDLCKIKEITKNDFCNNETVKKRTMAI